MAFELKQDEALRKGIRRIARKQMEKALEHLTESHNGSRDEAVHEARKCFKKVRAVLRMVRPVFGEKKYRAENISMRDAGRPLTEVRDGRILMQTLDLLVEHFKDHLAGRSFSHARQALQDHLRAERKRVLDDQQALTVVAEVVRKALARIKSWTDVPNRWATVGDGLQAVYRQAREAYRDARTDPAIEKLHEWRKQAKYTRYQLEILRPLWPERMEELASEADRMSQLLGDNHDLAVLRQMLSGDRGRFGGEAEVEMLLALIDRRRAELQQEAMLLGPRFFMESPRRFTRRLRGYWKTWRTPREAEQPLDAVLAKA